MITRRFRAVYALLPLVLMAFAALPAAAKTTVKQEIEIGQKAAKQIEKQFPVTDNKEWLADIDRMGHMLTPYVKRKEIPYTFKILKEKVNGKNEIDAFSLPGGPVYFSERMWRILSYDERLGVLGHEMTHVDNRHAIDTMSEAQRRGMWAAAVLIIAGARGGWWDATDMANQLYTLKYSRKREKEADMGGIDLCVAAHQSPVGLLTAMQKILHIEQVNGGTPPKILATHPATKERIDYLTARLQELGYKPADFQPRFTDTTDRIGNVLETNKKEKVITATTTRPLAVGDVITVKKPLWDDAKNAMSPISVARGTVKTAGSRPQLSLTMEPGFEFEDIESGDGVYTLTTPTPPKQGK